MAGIFDPAEFVNKIGERLVFEFEHAGYAGTPGLIGAARENPARTQLEKLMPGFVSTGTGIIMDSFDGFSAQQDIVFYERDLCPVYSINDTPEATFYPIEGVIATGEVKSVINKKILFDALDNIRSVKILRRFSQVNPSVLTEMFASFRPYGLGTSFAATYSDKFDQIYKYTDQIFSFIICKSFANSKDAVLKNIEEYIFQNGKEYLPNIIVSLNDGFIQNFSMHENKLNRSPIESDAIAFVPEVPRAFTVLVHELKTHARDGRTVPVAAFDRYMASMQAPLPPVSAIFYPQ